VVVIEDVVIEEKVEEEVEGVAEGVAEVEEVVVALCLAP